MARILTLADPTALKIMNLAADADAALITAKAIATLSTAGALSAS